MHDVHSSRPCSLRRAVDWRSAVALAGVILLGIAVLAPRSVAAQEGMPRLYQVEVVIFEQPAGTSVELAPRAAPVEALDDTLPADEPAPPLPAETDAAVEPAPGLPAGFAGPGAPPRLSNVAARMDRGGFRLLWHQAWIQPASSGAGQDLPLLAALGQGQADPGISGSVTLTAGRFLHLGLDLELRSAQGLEAELRQRRRIRFGEEHYFDDPRIGVIAVVSPVEPGRGSVGR